MKRKWRGPNAARLISFSEQMESSGEWSTVANSGVMMMQSGSWSGKVPHVSRQRPCWELYSMLQQRPLGTC